MYFDYPLEQGLRHKCSHLCKRFEKYFDYPLEQGLRHFSLPFLVCKQEVF